MLLVPLEFVYDGDFFFPGHYWPWTILVLVYIHALKFLPFTVPTEDELLEAEKSAPKKPFIYFTKRLAPLGVSEGESVIFQATIKVIFSQNEQTQ